MRFSLRISFVILTVMCLLLGRYTYINYKYNGWQQPGVTLMFPWQNPTVVKTERSLGQMTGLDDLPFVLVRRQFNLAPMPRSWRQKLHDSIVSYEPVALQIDVKHMDANTIDLIKNMNRLEVVIINRAALCYEPSLRKDVERIKKVLPDAEVFVEWQRKPVGEKPG